MFLYGCVIFPLQEQLYYSQPMDIIPFAYLEETVVKQNIVKGDRKGLVPLNLTKYWTRVILLWFRPYTMQVEPLLSPVHCGYLGETD